MKSRRELLQELVQLKDPKNTGVLRQDLAVYGWDSDAPLTVVDEELIVSILQRYLAGELTEEQIEEWAWAIEGRDDIAIGNEDGDNRAAFFAVAELANPSTEGDLTPERAHELIEELKSQE